MHSMAVNASARCVYKTMWTNGRFSKDVGCGIYFMSHYLQHKQKREKKTKRYTSHASNTKIEISVNFIYCFFVASSHPPFILQRHKKKEKKSWKPIFHPNEWKNWNDMNGQLNCVTAITHVNEWKMSNEILSRNIGHRGFRVYIRLACGAIH